MQSCTRFDSSNWFSRNVDLMIVPSLRDISPLKYASIAYLHKASKVSSIRAIWSFLDLLNRIFRDTAQPWHIGCEANDRVFFIRCRSSSLLDGKGYWWRWSSDDLVSTFKSYCVLLVFGNSSKSEDLYVEGLSAELGGIICCVNCVLPICAIICSHQLFIGTASVSLSRVCNIARTTRGCSVWNDWTKLRWGRLSWPTWIICWRLCKYAPTDSCGSSGSNLYLFSQGIDSITSWTWITDCFPTTDSECNSNISWSGYFELLIIPRFCVASQNVLHIPIGIWTRGSSVLNLKITIGWGS